jgi:hypothetical protein
VPEAERTRLLGEGGDEVALETLGDEDAVDGDADLAHVRVAASHRRRHDRVEIGVVEHDERRLSAQLEREPLDVASGQPHHAATGGRGAGDGDLAADRVGDELVADLAAGADDEVERPRWQSRVGEAANDVGGRQRRATGRLRDDGAACGERRRDFPAEQVDRVVPRHDRRDDANGLPQH